MPAGRKKQPPSSLDDDRTAVCGLWHRVAPVSEPCVLFISDPRLWIHDFLGDPPDPGYGLTYELLERDGQRFLQDSLGDGVSFSYRLVGDRLRLVLSPDRRDVRWDMLAGEWQRIK
jgi:hypothetical protein